MKLHLGCGPKKMAGWINVDSVAEFAPDLIHDIQQPLPYADLSVDEILAEDLLEHFDKYARFFVFYEWARVLNVGGTLTIQVPNFSKIIFRYFKFGFDKFVDMVFGECLLAAKHYIGHFGNHKWGYSPKTLAVFVQMFGFTIVKVETRDLNIRLTATKVKHVSWKELEGLAVASASNGCGVGIAEVSLGSIASKVKEFQKQGY